MESSDQKVKIHEEESIFKPDNAQSEESTEREKGESTDLPSNTETPPHSIKVRFKLRKLEIVARLQRIPAHTINLVPTMTEFYLDTFKYTKKYYLWFKYPQNIKVDADDCEVVFEGDYLKVVLPIIEIKDYATGKMMRKKGYKDQEESSDKKSQKKKSKRKLSSSNPKDKEQPNSKKEKQHDNSATLDMIENINKVEDEKRQIKLQKENARNAHFEEKEKEKEQRKRKRQKLREKSIAQAHQKKQNQKPEVPIQEKKENVVYCSSSSSGRSEVHSVRLSRKSCIMTVESLYESSVKLSSSLIASSKAFFPSSHAFSGSFKIS